MKDRHLLGNALAGFTVFLIALPLSVGISLASGAPPSAGLLSAIVGGIIGAVLGGSELTINGPAAGLIVIVLAAIQNLGAGDPLLGFKRMLAATVVAGILQILFGLFRLGKYGVSVPTSVLHGMMAAIGVSIVAKQVHVTMGVAPHSKAMLPLLGEIPESFQSFNPEVLIIALVGFIIILSFSKLSTKFTRFFPAPLAVVVVGMFLAHFMDFEHEHLVASHALSMSAGPKFLLNIPDHISSLFFFPDFSVWNTFAFFQSVITIALVASIESLLSAVAVDRMDPEKRTSDLERELVSKGICNALLGMIGGLPIIAEIVRSTANIRNGATARTSNLFHGIFLALFVALFPTILHQIPLSALAAILIAVGLTLAKPSQLFHLAEIGKGHALAFLVTLFVTLYEDLLVGVFCGILVEFIQAWIYGKSIRSLFHLDFRQEQQADCTYIQVKSPVVFSNWVKLSDEIEKNIGNNKVKLDFTEASLVDHSALEQIDRLRSRGFSVERLEVVFSNEHEAVSPHPLSAKIKKPV